VHKPSRTRKINTNFGSLGPTLENSADTVRELPTIYDQFSSRSLRTSRSTGRHQRTSNKMAHDNVWYSRPRNYGKGSRSW